MALPPLDSLLDLLPDNSSGQIEPVDLRNITETLYNGILDQNTDLQGYLLLAGGEMTGFLTLNDDPTLPKHAVTKRYVDAIPQILGYLLSDGSVSMDTGYAPVSPFDIATKQYADSNGLPLGGVAGQLLIKQSATDQDAAWENGPNLDDVAILDEQNTFTEFNTFNAIRMATSYVASNDFDVATLGEVNTLIPNITVSTADPSGGSDGDIWFKVE